MTATFNRAGAAAGAVAVSLGLFADRYEFGMVQSYLERGMTAPAVFDLHVRALPPHRGFLVAAGAARLRARLAAFRFDGADLAFLEWLGYKPVLLDYLRRFRFDGAVAGVPEGRLAFPLEPLVQVTAPLPMAQLVETVVLNAVHLETLLASKAARCFQAAGAGAPGAPALVDFGARRAHGADAALAAARCAFLAGFAGSSLVEADRRYGVPCFGTMAHSYVQAFRDEAEAFAAFARGQPRGATLLLDTYETLAGARRAVRVTQDLAAEGVKVGGVRLDSGDLGALAREVRGLLDAAGLQSLRIVASSGLDEHAIAALRAQGAPVDAYGVGTAVAVSDDLPALDVAYKLALYDGEPVLKTSPGKPSLPGAKQVWRRRGPDGLLAGDTLAAAGEAAEGEPLLQPLPEGPDDARALAAARGRFLEEFPRLPAAHRDLRAPARYPVAVSEGLRALRRAGLARAGRRGEPGQESFN